MLRHIIDIHMCSIDMQRKTKIYKSNEQNSGMLCMLVRGGNWHSVSNSFFKDLEF